MKYIIFILSLFCAQNLQAQVRMIIGDKCEDIDKLALRVVGKIDVHHYDLMFDMKAWGYNHVLLITKSSKFYSAGYASGIKVKYAGGTEVEMSNGFTEIVSKIEECEPENNDEVNTGETHGW